MKTIKKLLGFTKTNLEVSYLKIESDNLDYSLLGDIYYDSGLSKDIFNKIYITTLKSSLPEIQSNTHNSMLTAVKLALRKRRGVYFPDGVSAENIHGSKDVWTFVIFLAGLVIFSKPKDIKSFLVKILSNDIIDWLMIKDVEKVLYSIIDGDSKNVDVLKIRGFYGIEVEPTLQIDDSLLNIEKPNKIPVSTIEQVKEIKLTNKELGELFLVWVFKQAKNEGKEAYIEGEFIFVKSPLAFIEFGKLDKHPWKSIQKGALKLGFHESNNDGTPFHKEKGVNVMKYPSNIIDVL